MNTTEFDTWLESYMTRPQPRGNTQMKNAPGKSIMELINEERLRATGDYETGLRRALDAIDKANRSGKKPFYALKNLYAQACAEGNSEVVRGVKTAQFIFETPYKWIAGELIQHG